MQQLRGTKDILPNDIIFWQYLYDTASKFFTLSNYHEIRTPIIESSTLFKRSIGNATDIVNKEMYSFIDQGSREITLRPEGTASIARSFISNQLYNSKKINRLWYLGPMFRYERPQNGRQRQFHQLGIECIGSINPMADAEVIRIANSFLTKLKCSNYKIEINSIGNIEERNKYKEKLVQYLIPYRGDLDKDSQQKLHVNPLKILDSKNQKTQEILRRAPCLQEYLTTDSIKHFHSICEYLDLLSIKYSINPYLIRGLDYYNYTAFEIKTNLLGSQDTICGGGRYDLLIKQLGGPNTPSVGWAIGVERLLLLIQNNLIIERNKPYIYIAHRGQRTQNTVLKIISLLEEQEISFELNLENNNFQKQLKQASKVGAQACIIIGDDEVSNKSITIKWLSNHKQENISLINLSTLIARLKDLSSIN
uniref:histidine--tRNA ligase n=1 Tax=Mastocarpus papillatus TaxID=31436 RepID=A0A342RZC3_9FLOR|nr:histidine tRNA synthetase [Mastocarpus papillatus]AOL58069.1 histidine tRNA synthetase [Mastocarpus papillatus]